MFEISRQLSRCVCEETGMGAGPAWPVGRVPHADHDSTLTDPALLENELLARYPGFEKELAFCRSTPMQRRDLMPIEAFMV
ncbi:MAG: hypothetical protein JJE04_27315 [Acidobacteriia bacterium]|nr:hypothetical protein [Terriglobia bacterium]